VLFLGLLEAEAV